MNTCIDSFLADREADRLTKVQHEQERFERLRNQTENLIRFYIEQAWGDGTINLPHVVGEPGRVIYEVSVDDAIDQAMDRLLTDGVPTKAAMLLRSACHPAINVTTAIERFKLAVADAYVSAHAEDIANVRMQEGSSC